MITGNFSYEKFNFPTGEMQVRIMEDCFVVGKANIVFDFEKNEDIIELLLVCDALKRYGNTIENIVLKYCPFSRQDRVANKGECFSLAVFASLINGINAKSVTVLDPHSDVTPALLNNCKIVEQYEIALNFLRDEKKPFYLISPDGGALKKIYKLAKILNRPVLECSKLRDTLTGEICGVQVNSEKKDLEGVPCVIVDDICDGGRTFIEIANKLRSLNSGEITLIVTHGFFTKGLSVFDGIIDYIYTKDGKVK